MFSGLGTVIQKIKNDYEFVENNVTDGDDMIDQQDFEEYEPEKNEIACPVQMTNDRREYYHFTSEDQPSNSFSNRNSFQKKTQKRIH